MDEHNKFTGSTQGALSAVENLIESSATSSPEAKAKFQHAASTARQALDEFTEASREMLDDTVDSLKDTLGVGREKAKETYGQVKVEATDRFAALEDTVRERPGAALAVAAGIGVLLGLLLRGRSKVIYRPR